MWVEGNADYKPNPLTKDSPHLVSAGKQTVYSFKKGDIPSYMTDYFFHWVKAWKWYKKGYMPYAKGWMEHPWKVIKVFELFDRLNDSKGGGNAA